MKDFIREIKSQLDTLNADVYYKKTSKTENYIIYELEVYNKSFDRFEGQLIVEIRYKDIMDILDYQEQVIDLLDDYSYSTELSSATLNLAIINDISSIDDTNYVQELRFEFMAYRKE